MHDAQLPPAACLAAIEQAGRRATTPCGTGSLVWHVWGAGAPILLLHGNHGSWRHWARNIPDLARRFTVLAPDMPGNGESDLPPLPASLVSIVDILQAGMREIIGPEPLRAIFGFSHGSLAAGELARRMGTGAQCLMLVGPAGLGVPQGTRDELVRWRQLADKGARRAAHRRNLEILMIHDPARIDALAVEIQAFGAEMHRLRERPAMAPAPLAEALPEIKASILAIWGGADGAAGQYLQARRDRLAALRPEAAQFLIEGAGHWVQYEAAEEFNRLVRETLS
jgi:pimeloyl-ACP methyl ester carboxylesterase